MPASELRRLKELGAYDVKSLSSIIAESYICNVAYVYDGLPQCLPMTALVREHADGAIIYLHGHPSSRLIELVRKVDHDIRDGVAKDEVESKVRVCITTTKLDGISLSSAPNGHEFNYRSAVVHGACNLVGDRDEKLDVMRSLTNHIVPGRWDDVNPVASFAISLVQVIRVEIVSFSVKIRNGIPEIQPRNAEKDGPDRVSPPWTGVIPLYERLGAPIASGLTDNATIPSQTLRFIEERNNALQSYAEKAATINP